MRVHVLSRWLHDPILTEHPTRMRERCAAEVAAFEWPRDLGSVPPKSLVVLLHARIACGEGEVVMFPFDAEEGFRSPKNHGYDNQDSGNLSPEDLAGSEERRHGDARPVALCVGFDLISSTRLSDAFEEVGLRGRFEEEPSVIMQAVLAGGADLVIVHDRLALAEIAQCTTQLRRVTPAVKVLFAGDAPTGGRLLAAMRAGIVDWIDFGAGERDLCERLEHALELGKEERRRDERVARLKGICRKLTDGRSEIVREAQQAAGHMAEALEDVRERIDEAAIVGEFRGLISQELDVEDLLRTSMQYLLTKTGATNAAVFLPGTRADQFGLGAYVHYDCPRASAQPLLQRLCDDVCPKLATSDDLVRFSDTSEFVRSLGIEASVLDDAELVAWPARNGSECMGVFFLFRNKSEPFREELAGLIDALRPVFAAQMAKLVRVHHRSNFQWPRVQSEHADDASDAEDDEDAGDEWRRAA